jgi:hypothetical protein
MERTLSPSPKVHEFEPVISRYTAVQAKLLQDVTHMGVVIGRDVRPFLKVWLEGLAEHE